MQFPGAAPPPVGVLFDSAFDRIDDLLALALLYGLDGKGEMRMTAVTVSRPDFAAAQFCDIVKRFYSGSAGGFGFGASFPVGLAARTGEAAACVLRAAGQERRRWRAALQTGARNLQRYSRPRNRAAKRLDGVAAAQFHRDRRGSANHACARLLALTGSKELIALNVRCLAIAAGPWIAADAQGRPARLRRMAHAHLRVQRGTRRCRALPRRKHRKGFRLVEGSSRGGCVPRVRIHALRCAYFRHGCRALRGSPQGGLFQVVRPRRVSCRAQPASNSPLPPRASINFSCPMKRKAPTSSKR